MSISPFRQMADRWPSTICARCQVDTFSGGIVKPSYMANLDSRGEGPARLIRCGRKVGYPVEDLVAWLEDRCEEKIVKRPGGKSVSDPLNI
jgi:hypothetical protein